MNARKTKRLKKLALPLAFIVGLVTFPLATSLGRQLTKSPHAQLASHASKHKAKVKTVSHHRAKSQVAKKKKSHSRKHSRHKSAKKRRHG